MKYLCSSYFKTYEDLLRFTRKLKQKDILTIIVHQEGIIFKRYTYNILYYRINDVEECASELEY